MSHGAVLGRRGEGRDLDRSEVDAIVQRMACMTMERRDAQASERRRGYADLDPELAWEQWEADKSAGQPGSV